MPDELFEEEKLLGDSLCASQFASALRESRLLMSDSTREEEDESGSWKVPISVITSTGRKIVGRDPNITEGTLRELFESEAKYIPDSFRELFSKLTAKEIVEQVFMSSHGLGLSHLTLCIKEHPNQTMADLIANYSNDRRLPFVIGAAILDAYRKTNKFFYYERKSESGFEKVFWEPRKVYIKPVSVLPPTVREFKKHYFAPVKKPTSIPPCPDCGSEAKIVRVGYRGQQYHVCCTDPTGKCRWYMGTIPADNEKKAYALWCEICNKSKEKL